MGQANLIAFLAEEEGEAGLRMLFDEVCADTPELRARLAAHDMLLTRPFDPDAAVARDFVDRDGPLRADPTRIARRIADLSYD